MLYVFVRGRDSNGSASKQARTACLPLFRKLGHYHSLALNLRGNVPVPGMLPPQAKPPAQAFIGYGGVTIREAVRKGADWFVTDFEPLMEALGESDRAQRGEKRQDPQ